MKLSPVPVLLAVLCAIIGCAGTSEGSSAVCATSLPRIETSPAQASPDEPLRIHGEGFYGDFICDDTGSPISSMPAGGRPTDGIRIEFLQGTRTWTLATVASDENLEFDAEGFKVPADAAPGEAVVRDTSPSVDPRMLPPQADAPLLVLDDPGTGGTRIAAGAVEGG